MRTCEKCGSTIRPDEPPHESYQDCMRRLQEVRDIARDALVKVQAIARSFSHDPRVLNRVDLTVSQALAAMGEIIESHR